MDFPSVFDFSNLDGRNGFTLEGVVPVPLSAGSFAYNETGASISIAGDVNGDGIDDMIIGAPSADSPNGFSTGASYVVFGRREGFGKSFDLSGLDGSNGFVINGIRGYTRDENGNLQGYPDGAGATVNSAGDVNNDGIDDVILIASGVNNRSSVGDADGSGESYVVFGRRTEFAASVELSDLDGSDGFAITGVDRSLYIEDVSSAGDLNNDGVNDFIVGTPGRGGRVTGKSYVIFGQANGFDTSIEFDSLDGSNGFVLNGVTVFDEVGSAVSAAGDINNDGIDDVVIGASGSSKSYVVFGQNGGFGASVDLSDLDGSNGFAIKGTADSRKLGAAVSHAGDINGDGIDDFILGAPTSYLTGSSFPGSFTLNFRYAGESYVVFGSEAGFEASFDLENLDGSNGFRIKGLTARGRLGSLVSAAGDINNDGVDDFIVGSTEGDNFVVFGSREGFGASLDLAGIDGSNGFALGEFDSFVAVDGGGDVNGDGISDLVAGNPQIERRTDDGRSRLVIGGGYVIYGRGSDSTDIPIVNGRLATIYVDADGTVLGNAFEAGEAYAGRLTSNTDGSDNSNDVILGTAADDSIWAGRDGQSDIVFSGAGNDVIGTSSDSSGVNASGNRAELSIEAGAGDDFVYAIDNGYRSLKVDLGSGDDSFWASGGNNDITASSGNNTIGLARGGDRVTTGAGNDFVYATDNTYSDDFVDLGDGNNQVWLLSGVNNITTGSGDDIIGMGLYNDTVDAGDGNNVVYATNDREFFEGYTKTVRAGSGEDYIETGSGDDIIDGGRGLNSLYGKSGSDTFTIREDAYNFLGDFELGSDRIQLADLSFEQLAFFQGSAGTDKANSTFIFVDSVGIAEVTNSTVAALDNAANFV